MSRRLHSATPWWEHDTLLVAGGGPPVCVQEVAIYAYTVTATGVRSGTVPLRMVFRYDGQPDPPEVVPEHNVTVP